MHATDLSVLLKALCQQDFMVATGRGNGTTYSLKSPGQVAEMIPQQTGIFENIPTTNRIAQGETSLIKVETSGEKVETSPQKVETSSEKVETSFEGVETSMEEVETSRNTEAAANTLAQQLLTAASSGWHSLAELAAATNKSGKYLINKVIPILISEGKLERRYDTANHPRQAYRRVN